MMDSDDENAAGADKGRRPTRREKPSETGEEEKEGFKEKLNKGLAGCGLCCFKLKSQTQISALEYKITNRQKKFGVDYLTLVERKASQAALKDCLKEALRELGDLQRQVNEHFDNIESREGAAKEQAANQPERSLPKKKSPPKKAAKEEQEEVAEEEPEEEQKEEVEETADEPVEEKKPAKKKKGGKKKKKPKKDEE